jgi:hypothetical protein
MLRCSFDSELLIVIPTSELTILGPRERQGSPRSHYPANRYNPGKQGVSQALLRFSFLLKFPLVLVPGLYSLPELLPVFLT